VQIAIGSDHAGFELKELLKSQLELVGDEVIDFGTDSTESCDYPDIALPLASAIAEGKPELGVLICSNGVGPSIAANKVNGVRAAVCHDVFSVKRARQHTNINVLCLGAWAIGQGHALEILLAFRDAKYEGGRHDRRLSKISKYEESQSAPD
jgi:ribose 5-phosphate isomerase B